MEDAISAIIFVIGGLIWVGKKIYEAKQHAKANAPSYEAPKARSYQKPQPHEEPLILDSDWTEEEERAFFGNQNNQYNQKPEIVSLEETPRPQPVAAATSPAPLPVASPVRRTQLKRYSKLIKMNSKRAFVLSEIISAPKALR